MRTNRKGSNFHRKEKLTMGDLIVFRQKEKPLEEYNFQELHERLLDLDPKDLLRERLGTSPVLTDEE